MNSIDVPEPNVVWRVLPNSSSSVHAHVFSPDIAIPLIKEFTTCGRNPN